MPTTRGQYVSTSIQIRPDQRARLDQAVWNHEYESVSDAVRRFIDLLMPVSSEKITHVVSIPDEEKPMREHGE